MNELSNTESKNCVNRDDILLAQIRECFGRVAYTHKTHEKQVDILVGKDSFWKWIQIILSAIVSCSLLAVLNELFCLEKLWSLLGIIFAVILTAINLCLINFNYGAKAQQHKEVAVHLWNIREKYISLITDLMTKSIDVSTAIETRDELQVKLIEIYKNAPRTASRAYKMAQAGLKFKEELTFSADEIDMLLPKSIRLKGR